jgi:ABC-type sugar transport system permease subunit
MTAPGRIEQASAPSIPVGRPTDRPTTPASLAGRRPGRPKRRFETAYLYLLPAVALLGFVFLYPTLQSVWLAFQHNKGINDPGRWAGIDNFIRLWNDPLFWKITGQTFLWTVGVVAITTVLAYLLALILVQSFRGKAIFRTLVILPAATSLALSAVVWKFAFEPNNLVNHTLAGFGPTKGSIAWLANVPQAWVALIFVGICVSVPLTAVMLSAAMRAVPRDLYEAASIDGASRAAQTWRITLPLTRTMLLIVTLANFVVAFNSFPIIFVMTNGGPINRTDILATWLYQKGFQLLDFGMASTLAVVVLGVLLLLSLAYVHLLIHRTKVG